MFVFGGRLAASCQHTNELLAYSTNDDTWRVLWPGTGAPCAARVSARMSVLVCTRLVLIESAGRCRQSQPPAVAAAAG